MGNPVWAANKSSRTGGEGQGEEEQEAATEEEEEEEEAYRLHVVRRLPGLLTLDCLDVSEVERGRAKSLNEKVSQ